ncbi:MAG: hypothetical protein FVQ83_07225 [Chloroflexi bacterium]|nr:hypothetical protein [Chloroflexota bacterium]
MSKSSRIDPEIIKKIIKAMGLKQRQTYNKIHSVANMYNIPQNFAAIKLASELGIGIQKYATDEYYAALSGVRVKHSQVPKNNNGELPTQVTRKIVVSKQHPLVEIDLSSVVNPELIKILERDISELNCAIKIGIEKTKKTCMILSGSIAEALLLERLTRDNSIEQEAIQVASTLKYPGKPSKLNNLESWVLVSLVEVGSKLNTPVLPADSLDQIGQLRKWRNLIHPGRELKDNSNKRIRPTKTRAKNAIGFLEFVASELN